jgi:thiol-disulfide isomerase/thioredoxin
VIKSFKIKSNAFVFIAILILFPFHVFPKELQVGDKAPNLIGNNATTGNRLSLNRIITQMTFKRDAKGRLIIGTNGKYVMEFKKKAVVLNFFSKTCIPCIREIPIFNRLASKFKDQQVVFFYVNVDPNINEKEAKRLIGKYNIKAPMMLVNQNEAIRKYNANQLPRLVVIDREAKIFKIFTGFDDNLESLLTKDLNKLLLNL